MTGRRFLLSLLQGPSGSRHRLQPVLTQLPQALELPWQLLFHWGPTGPPTTHAALWAGWCLCGSAPGPSPGSSSQMLALGDGSAQRAWSGRPHCILPHGHTSMCTHTAPEHQFPRWPHLSFHPGPAQRPPTGHPSPCLQPTLGAAPTGTVTLMWDLWTQPSPDLKDRHLRILPNSCPIAGVSGNVAPAPGLPAQEVGVSCTQHLLESSSRARPEQLG